MAPTDSAASVRHPLIDADAHVVETEHTWDFLEPEMEKYRPKLFSSPGESNEYWVINGRIGGFRFATMTEKELKAQSEKTGRLVNAERAASEMDDVSLRLNGMDQLGIDVQVLHNSLWIESVAEIPEVEAALCRSWNRWMADIFDKGQGRLYWTCVVPTYDLESAITEMRFAKEHGAVALCLRPFEGDLIVTDPYFYPLFDEAVRLDLAVAIHIGNGSPDLTRLLRTRRPSGGGWAPFRVPTVVATMSIITSSVTKDFPTLRWGIIEASASWVPWLCHEVQRRSGKPFTPESNPFKEHNIYVTAQVDDDIAYIVNGVGEDVLLIGTDFGHTDASSEYDALVKLRTMSGITENARQKMLSVNPAKLYALQDRAKVADSLIGI